MKNNKFILPIAGVIVIAVAILAFNGSGLKEQKNSTSPNPSPSAVVSEKKIAVNYRNGQYKAVGSYVSPGGPREIEVVLTLEDGTIVDSVFVGNATDPASKRFQGEFSDNYKTFVIGKNIDEISLTKVSGSSLTPKGFNDAVEKIKAEARS